MTETPSTAFTLENMYLLEEALVMGARRVKFKERDVEFRSLKDMQSLLVTFKKKLGLAKTSNETIIPKFKKGH